LNEISVELGSSVIFVGANGGGKTRLAEFIENTLGASAHHISAHRALSLNPAVPEVSEALALSGLRTGWSNQASILTCGQAIDGNNKEQPFF
jgi:recombinational DNA repair ATPase RecF